MLFTLKAVAGLCIMAACQRSKRLPSRLISLADTPLRDDRSKQNRDDRSKKIDKKYHKNVTTSRKNSQNIVTQYELFTFWQ